MPRRGKWKYIKILILYMTWYKSHLKVDWDKLIMHGINPKATTKNANPRVIGNKLYVY